MKKILAALIFIAVTVIAFFTGFLGFVFITDYTPPAEIEILPERAEVTGLSAGNTVTLLTYNIGYCGLDKGRDFFMDGGVMSRSESREKTLENLENITAFIRERNADITLIQEIDNDSSRSFHVNETEHMRTSFPERELFFAQNYLVKWVPVPLKNPMGSADSGLGALTRYKPSCVRRYQLPGKESFFRQMFDLDRCMMALIYELPGGKQLVIVNLHLSAYDKGGKVRKYQMAFLKDYMKRVYDGNTYLILGGDWNHLLSPRLLAEKDPDTVWPYWLQLLPEDLLPEDFKWAYDDTVMTVRDNDRPYVRGRNFETIIDGFLVSPNIEIVSVKGFDLGFEHSDHNPVECVLKLK